MVGYLEINEPKRYLEMNITQRYLETDTAESCPEMQGIVNMDLKNVFNRKKYHDIYEENIRM
jgi:hypothetical protein